MVDYREILRLNNLGYTKKDIASSVHSSRNTVFEVLTLAGKLCTKPPCSVLYLVGIYKRAKFNLGRQGGQIS